MVHLGVPKRSPRQEELPTRSGSRYVLVYFLRCLARVPSQNALPDVLFTDEHLMSRIGFNAHHGCGESAEGTGRTGRKKKVRLKEGLSTITEYFTGFQLVWAYVPQLGLPMALGFSKSKVGPRGHEDAYKKQFVAPTINAVVVLTENGKDADKG